MTQPMCVLPPDRKVWVQPEPGGAHFEWTYVVYKCKKEELAICQLKQIDAPPCPGKCHAA